MQQSVLTAQIAGYFMTDFPNRFPEATQTGFDHYLRSVVQSLEEHLKINDPVEITPTPPPDNDEVFLGKLMAAYAIGNLTAATALGDRSSESDRGARLIGSLAGARAMNQGVVFVLAQLDSYMNELAYVALTCRTELANELHDTRSLGDILLISQDPARAESAQKEIHERFRGWFSAKSMADKCDWLFRVLKVPENWSYSEPGHEKPLGDQATVLEGIRQMQSYRASIVHHSGVLSSQHAGNVGAVTGEEVAMSRGDLRALHSDVLCLITAFYVSSRTSLCDMSDACPTISVETGRDTRWQYDLITL